MSLIAELRLTGSQLVMLPSLRAAPGMTIEREWATRADRASDPVLFVWAKGGDFDAFEAALPDDPTISEFECVDVGETQRLYRVVVNRESGTTSPSPIDRQTGASRLAITTTVDGAVLKIRLPERDSLTEYIALLRESGFDVELLRAYHADDDGREEYDLTEKQAEALRAALAAGYFEVPRETDMDRLADQFDISAQALSERLRRGVSSVLQATVGEPRTGENAADATRDESATPDGTGDGAAATGGTRDGATAVDGGPARENGDDESSE